MFPRLTCVILYLQGIRECEKHPDPENPISMEQNPDSAPSAPPFVERGLGSERPSAARHFASYSFVLDYLLAIALTYVTYLSRLVLEPHIGFSGRYLVFATVAGIAAFFWGTGPGIVSAILGWALGFLAMPPGFEGADHASTYLTYAVCVGLILGLQYGLRRATIKLHAAHQEKLRIEAILKTALEFSKSAVTAQDKELRFEWVHATRVFDPDRLLGRHETELEDRIDELIKLKREAWERGFAQAEMSREINGEQRHFLFKVARVKIGDWEGLITKSIDVTELVDQKRRLEVLNSHLNDLVEDRTAELREKNIALRDLTRDLIRVEVAERERIARLLHDDVQQALVAAKIRADAAGRSAPEINLKPMTDLIGTAIHDIRQLTRELTYEVWFTEGIEGALDKLADSMEQRFNVKIGRRERIAPEIGKALDPTVRGVVFDSIREAVFNAIKHAQGSGIEIGLESAKDRLVANIVDGGSGFPASAATLVKNAGGLSSMRRRLRAIGGDMTLSTRPEGGGAVRIEVPLQPNEMDGREYPLSNG